MQSLKDYIQIFTSAGKHIVKSSLTAFAEQLPDAFLRTHRSYIVNLNKVTALTSSDIEIHTHEIPIGENYRKNLSAYFKK